MERLLSPDRAAAARTDVAGKMAKHYAGSTASNAEMQRAEQVFRLLARDAELKVRLAMAEHLQRADRLPRDVAVVMAQDPEDAVALPMLKHSAALSEDDLVALVRATDAAARQLAVSERREMPPRVAGELLAKDRPEVAHALAANHAAELDEWTLSTIIERYGNDGGIMQALAERGGLPLHVAAKVLNAVSGAAAERMRGQYTITEEDLRFAAERARETATLEMLQATNSLHTVEALVDQLALSCQLTHSLMLQALSRGHVQFFEASLGHLSGVTTDKARALLSDRGDLGFRAIYNKAGLPPDMFGAVRLLLQVVKEQDSRESRRGGHAAHRVVEQLRAAAGTGEEENLDELISLLRGGLH